MHTGEWNILARDPTLWTRCTGSDPYLILIFALVLSRVLNAPNMLQSMINLTDINFYLKFYYTLMILSLMNIMFKIVYFKIFLARIILLGYIRDLSLSLLSMNRSWLLVSDNAVFTTCFQLRHEIASKLHQPKCPCTTISKPAVPTGCKLFLVTTSFIRYYWKLESLSIEHRFSHASNSTQKYGTGGLLTQLFIFISSPATMVQRNWFDQCAVQTCILPTVKASNFGPLFASSVASLVESCTKNEQNRFVNLKVFYNFYYLHLSVGWVSLIASDSEKEVQT
jgi:hypothetical protein